MEFEMDQRRQDGSYIDLAELFGALMQRRGLIILVTILFGIIGFLYSAFLATPLYSASAMMIVNSGERNDYVTQDQLNSAATLVETYSVIITSDTVMDDVIHNLNMEDTFQSDVKSISVAAVNETQIMKITVTATDPQIALDVCEEITNIAPDVIVKTVKAGSVELVSRATTTWKQVSPNVKRNTAVAMALGLLLSAAFVIVVSILDNKIKSETDLKMADLTILGVIPYYDLEAK